jgi:hypothetical protein
MTAGRRARPTVAGRVDHSPDAQFRSDEEKLARPARRIGYGAASYATERHTSAVMLKFRYTCPRHQALFTEILREEGCTDPAKMDEARRMVLSWLSEKYPLIVFEHFARESCIGCDFEAARLNLDDIAERLRQVARELARR